MNFKRFYDAAMIYIIGVAPLGMEYLKKHAQQTTFTEKVQNDINKQIQQKAISGNQSKTLSTPNHISLEISNAQLNVQQIIKNQIPTTFKKNIYQRLSKLKQWKQTNIQKYIKQVFAITTLHSIGGMFYPSQFFISILGYFVLYQINFVNDVFILQGKPKLVQQSKFSFQKINNLYLGLSCAAIGLAGISKGINIMASKAINKKL